MEIDEVRGGLPEPQKFAEGLAEIVQVPGARRIAQGVLAGAAPDDTWKRSDRMQRHNTPLSEVCSAEKFRLGQARHSGLEGEDMPRLGLAGACLG